MDNIGSGSTGTREYQVLGEILFHNKMHKSENVTLLCSRLLARYNLTTKFSNSVCMGNKSSNRIDTNDDQSNTEEQTNSSYETSSLLLHNEGHCSINDSLIPSGSDCSERITSSNENECLNIQEQLENLNIDESDLYKKWYAYWEKNGDDFVNETWIKQYGSCTTDDLPIDVEELYTKHREEQYQVLYWKYMNEIKFTTTEVEESTYNNYGYDKEYDSIPHSNFDFLYKFKNFQEVNHQLIKSYKALSEMGHIYNDQNIFHSAYVQYLKKHLIRSTRHLNVYRFPKNIKSNYLATNTEPKFLNGEDLKFKNYSGEDKLPKNRTAENEVTDLIDEKCKLSLANISSCSDSSEKTKVKNKKVLKKEQWKQEREKHIVEELEKFGYSYLLNNPKLFKYWKKRHLIFSKFEKGVQLDEESWYSVTPEIISYHIAERCSCYLIIDPFCGAGGNIIQFAMTCELVIAIDNDPKKIKLAQHNAELYGVADRIQFIVGDFFTLASTLKADVVFLSPPWGGPDLMNLEVYNISNIMPNDGGGEQIMRLARQITPNIAFHLPKNTNIFECIKLVDDGYVEVQQNILNSRYNSITVYFSELYGLCDEDADINKD